eukprot:10537835-Ditylum_brightwellii.AAC.1
MIKNTAWLHAQHQAYFLRKAEEKATATFPLLLEELLASAATVPPIICDEPVPPPTTRTKYSFATTQLLGFGQKGPGPSPL